MPEKYTVTLTPEERQQLLQLTHQNKLGARRLKRLVVGDITNVVAPGAKLIPLP
ncbi:hypothetical protein H6F90_01090 [Trichocoleus sp. FACHB-591]|uniref:hypothetical protein n=1 Tax=Trichocoleus TaxID=450526 RepID=UPI00168746A7|nr:hypothetical protein [Trichocoleus sp. FACHB-591]